MDSARLRVQRRRMTTGREARRCSGDKREVRRWRIRPPLRISRAWFWLRRRGCWRCGRGSGYGGVLLTWFIHCPPNDERRAADGVYLEF
ncbi:hypothetical protein EE612_058789 [Oryza sativa]|nr:hypothetical protein EE612_058789 [Oryza sativa]